MNILKGMCINTKYSMSIIEKVFFYEENEISAIKTKGEVWFRGNDIAKAIRFHIRQFVNTLILKTDRV